MEKPAHILCTDHRLVTTDKLEKALPFRVKEKESIDFCNEVFSQHYKNAKMMTPKNMPCLFDNFDDFLNHISPEPSPTSSHERRVIWSNSGEFSNDVDKVLKSFLCKSLKPIFVEDVAGAYVSVSYKGDVFPQFTLCQGRRMEFCCELCGALQHLVSREKPRTNKKFRE